MRLTRGHCKPTHTCEGSDLDEAFLLARCAHDYSAWLTPAGKLILGLTSDFLLIPGRQGLHEVDVRRVGKTAVFPLELIRCPQYVNQILVQQDKARQAIESKKLTVLPTGALVAQSGKHWVTRSRAEQARVRHGLIYTHTLKGWGNDGPRGRQWWIEKKFTDFTPMPYELYGEQMPFSEQYPYCIDVRIGDWKDGGVMNWLYEARAYRSHWRYALRKDRYGVSLGFANLLDYGAFVQFVVALTGTRL